MTASIVIKNIDPRTLGHLPSKNPNVMEVEKLAALQSVIEKEGFLQPILVVEENGVYLVVDGEHRTQVALELSLETIPAVVAPDRKRAEILRLALNRLRGELDLAEVGRQLQALSTEFEVRELEMTGFAEWEIKTMLEGFEFDEDVALNGAATTPPAPDKPQTYKLTLQFASESDRAYVKDAMKRTGEATPAEQMMELVAFALAGMGGGQ